MCFVFGFVHVSQCISHGLYLTHESGTFRDRRHLSSIVTSFSILWSLLCCVFFRFSSVPDSCSALQYSFFSLPHSLYVLSLYYCVVCACVRASQVNIGRTINSQLKIKAMHEGKLSKIVLHHELAKVSSGDKLYLLTITIP